MSRSPRRSSHLVRRLRGNRGRAFTLMEMLVALLISTLLVAAAASVFVTATRGWERGTKAARTLQTGRALSELLERHLRSAIPSTPGHEDVMFGEAIFEGERPGHRLTFVTGASTRLRAGGSTIDTSVVELTYDPALGDGLRMRVLAGGDDVFDTGGFDLLLSPGVEGFNVRYFDGQGWFDSWYESGLPKAVEFELSILDPEEAVTAEDMIEGEGGSSGSGGNSGSGGASGSGAGGGTRSGETSGGSGSGAGGSGFGDEEGVTAVRPGFHVRRLVVLPMGGGVSQSFGEAE